MAAGNCESHIQQRGPTADPIRPKLDQGSLAGAILLHCDFGDLAVQTSNHHHASTFSPAGPCASGLQSQGQIDMFMKCLDRRAISNMDTHNNKNLKMHNKFGTSCVLPAISLFTISLGEARQFYLYNPFLESICLSIITTSSTLGPPYQLKKNSQENPFNRDL